jgi:C1A family cysteine protease
MDVTFGYRPDPRVGTDADGNEFDWIEKDRDFQVELRPKLTLEPGDVDMSGNTTETNQFGLSACAGNATGDGIEVLNDIAEKDLAAVEKRAPNPTVQVSRLFIYSMARSLMDDDGDGEGDIGKDEGTYIRLCFEILSRFGVCDEKVWAYDESKVFTAPSIKALRQAVGHRIHSYYRIKELADARLDAMVAALQAKHPIVFGTQIDQAFMQRSGPGVVGPPTGATAGGHAMLCVGYVNGNFLVKNSWGKGWRDNGFVLFTPEYMTAAITTDLWVPTLGTVFR